MRKLQIIMALLIAVVLISFSCAPKPPPPPPAAPPTEWDRIVEAAKKEGTVAMYQGMGVEVATSIREGFMRAHPGIKVESIVLGGTEVRERVRMEQQTGVYMCDLILSGWAVPVDMVDLGFAQKVEVELPAAQEKDVWRTHPYQYDPKKEMIALVNSISIAVFINTDLVKPGEIKSWYDLLDPKWKGKMVWQDPRSAGSSLGMFNFIELLGEDFWRKMAQQDIVVERGSGRVIDMVVHGEKALSLFASDTRAKIALDAGAPLGFLHLKEGTSTILKGASPIKNAPHPNATLVFLNWLMTKEGQTAVAKPQGCVTIRKDIVEDWVSPEMRFDAPYKLLEPLGADPRYGEKTIAFGTKILGKL